MPRTTKYHSRRNRLRRSLIEELEKRHLLATEVYSLVLDTASVEVMLSDGAPTIPPEGESSAPEIRAIDDHPLGRDNRSIEFHAGDDSVHLSSLGLSAAGPGRVTVEFWMKPDQLKGMPFGFDRYDLYFYGGAFGFNTGNADLFGISDASELDGNWHHIAAVFTRSDVHQNELYIDGVKQELSQILSHPYSPNAQFGDRARISGWTHSEGYKFDGKIDELRIWQGARTPRQIRDLMHSRISGPRTDLLASYSFEDANSQFATDRSQNGRHGAINGVASPTSLDAPERLPQLHSGTTTTLDIDASSAHSPLTYAWTEIAPGGLLDLNTATDVVALNVNEDFEHDVGNAVAIGDNQLTSTGNYGAPSGRAALLVSRLTGLRQTYFDFHDRAVQPNAEYRLRFWGRSLSGDSELLLTDALQTGRALQKTVSIGEEWKYFDLDATSHA